MGQHTDVSARQCSYSAEYLHIDNALKARWLPFVELTREFESFLPKLPEEFAGERAAALAEMRSLNPHLAEERLLADNDQQFAFFMLPEMQTSMKFSARIMAEYVTVAFLAHALAEALINAVLAVGLTQACAVDLFTLVERADIKEKWLAGPKAFHPTYAMSKGSALYHTLQHLTQQRNALVHYKIELHMHGKKQMKGSNLVRGPLCEELKWIRRFFSLPYDLAAHVTRQVPTSPAIGLLNSGPIERFAGHLKP